MRSVENYRFESCLQFDRSDFTEFVAKVHSLFPNGQPHTAIEVSYPDKNKRGRLGSIKHSTFSSTAELFSDPNLPDEVYDVQLSSVGDAVDRSNAHLVSLLRSLLRVELRAEADDAAWTRIAVDTLRDYLRRFEFTPRYLLSPLDRFPIARGSVVLFLRGYPPATDYPAWLEDVYHEGLEIQWNEEEPDSSSCAHYDRWAGQARFLLETLVGPSHPYYIQFIDATTIALEDVPYAARWSSGLRVLASLRDELARGRLFPPRQPVEDYDEFRALTDGDHVQWLQYWYAAQCNGDWEHGFGVDIGTLDNPGWSVKINLAGTALDGVAMEKVDTKEDDDDDWSFCSVEENVFEAACGPLKLNYVCGVFRRWAEGAVRKGPLCKS